MAGIKHQIVLKASTLVETMVALTILSLVMGTAMVVFIRVSSSSLSFDRIRAGFLARNAMEDVRQNKLYIDSEEEIGQIRLIRTVSAYPGEGRLVKVEITAVGPDERLLSVTHSLFSQDE